MGLNERLAWFAKVGFFTIAAVFLFVNCYWVYTSYNGTAPVTVTAAFINELEDAQGNKRSFMEVNVYEASVGSGVPLKELRVNAYTETDQLAIKGYGIQQVGRLPQIEIYNYYSNTADGLSREATGSEQLKIAADDKKTLAVDGGTFLVVSIPNKETGKNELFGLHLDGSYTRKWTTTDAWKNAGNTILSLGGLIRWQPFGSPTIHHEETRNYTISQFFDEIIDCASYTSYGYGSYEISLMELEHYFSLYKYDGAQFVKIPKTTEVFQYFGLRVNRSRYGAVFANQSLFGAIKYKHDYSANPVGKSLDFGNFMVSQRITEKDFTLRYNAVEDGYYMSLNNEVKNRLAYANNLNVEVKIDLANHAFYGKKILGFDRLAMYGLNTVSMSIKASTMQDFTLSEYSLWNTNIQTFTSENLNLIIDKLAFNGKEGVLA